MLFTMTLLDICIFPYHMSHVMRKPALCLCKRQRRRSACVSAQSDQRFSCSQPRREKTCFVIYANSKGSDQLAHLISAFVVRCLDSIIPLLAIPKILRPWLVSIAEQASLSLTRSQTLKTGFLVTWLIHTLNPKFQDPF